MGGVNLDYIQVRNTSFSGSNLRIRDGDETS